jgi:methanethiol S-methyltransferase
VHAVKFESRRGRAIEEFDMAGVFAALYAVITYVIFLATFLYAIGFVGNVIVPRSIDAGISAPPLQAVLIDLALLGLFAIQHSVMARPAFKRAWTKLVPEPVERSTYVLLASSILILLFWQWRSIPLPIWAVSHPYGVLSLNLICALGWAIVLLSTFLLDHFELFGLRQAFAHARGASLPQPVFRTPFLYRWVRHPLYLGFLLAFWATPAMTAGHLLFAVATTGYILVGILLEERDLITQFGDQYRRYRASVGMLLPLRRRGSSLDRASPVADQANRT